MNNGHDFSPLKLSCNNASHSVAAYRHSIELDGKDDTNFSRKKHVEHSELPLPEWAAGRQQLYSKLEEAEDKSTRPASACSFAITSTRPATGDGYAMRAGAVFIGSHPLWTLNSLAYGALDDLTSRGGSHMPFQPSFAPRPFLP